MAKQAERLKKSLAKARKVSEQSRRSYLKAETALTSIEDREARERERDAALQSELRLGRTR